MKTFLSALLIAFLMWGCSNENTKEEAAATELKGYDISYLDTTVNPADDFFLYANNGWLKENEIPPAETMWGTFMKLRNDVLDKLRSSVEAAANSTDNEPGSAAQLAGDYYAAGMDSAGVEAAGTKDIQPILDKIYAAKDKKEASSVAASLYSQGVRMLFSLYVDQDAKKSDEHVIYLSQGGLGLPDRDYYFREDERSKLIREKYLEHIANILTLSGKDETYSQNAAKGIYELESELAGYSWTRVENRNPVKTYNKMSVDELAKSSPDFDWKQFFTEAGLGSPDSLVIGQPPFFSGYSKSFKKVSLDILKDYLAFGLLNTLSPYLNSAYVNQNFSFYSQTLSGAKELHPRWKRVLKSTDRSVGDATGQLFVKKYFPPEAKQKVNEMVDNLLAAYKERLQNLSWMSDSTKVRAMEKLNKVNRKLGYPDKWKDYSTLKINRSSYVLNQLKARAFGWNEMVNKLGKPVDRGEWVMSAPTVNAYYNPVMNEIVFPAGIMQFPFFDINQDDALNYGAMGAVIGHELTHGFDDQGSQFAADGNMVNWWTEEDHKKFKEKTDLLADHFNRYVAIDTLHVNGRLTLGENIADLGGLTISYYAYLKSLEGKEKKVIDGFTPEQRVFLGWARNWCNLYTDEALEKQVLTNPHSPSNFRVNGPLSNMPEFYAAFGVKEGNKMFRPKDDMAIIW